MFAKSDNLIEEIHNLDKIIYEEHRYIQANNIGWLNIQSMNSRYIITGIEIRWLYRVIQNIVA